MKITSTQVFLGVLMTVTAIPLLTTDAYRFQDGRSTTANTDIIEYARDSQAAVRAARRAFSRAVTECQDKLRAGEKITCPDINDEYDYKNFLLDGAEDIQAPLRPSAPDLPVLSNPRRDPDEGLSAADRLLLRTSTRSGTCSDYLPDALKDLCEQLVSETQKVRRTTGFTSDIAEMKRKAAPEPASLRRRMQMLEEARDRTNRREDVEPMRLSN